MSLMRTPCSVISNTAGTVTDIYGNAVSTQSTVDTFCDLQQIRADEPARAGETSVATWNLYLPIATTIDTSDVVVVDSKSYEVVGEPWYAEPASAAVKHVKAKVVRAT